MYQVQVAYQAAVGRVYQFTVKYLVGAISTAITVIGILLLIAIPLLISSAINSQ